MMKKLPSNDYPVFTFEIPSTGEKKRFRPFLVKEAKALMISEGTKDRLSMLETLKFVIQSACLDEIDIDTLATFDCEFLLIKLRSISVVDEIVVYMDCPGEEHPDDKTRRTEVKIDLGKVEVTNLDREKRKIKLSENKMVIMNYPRTDILEVMLNTEEAKLDYTEIVAKCIDQIIVDDEIYNKDEMDKADLDHWIETLDRVSFEKLTDFLTNLPYTRLKVEWDCPVCKRHNTKYLIGLEAFFL